MDAILLIDFGSTYTKLTAVDIENEEIIATAKDLTTVESDIMIGFNNAYKKLEEKMKGLNVNFVDKLACSSAAGGLKMIAIGLVPELTAEAAKRAALGAGARILGVYSYELSRTEMKEILDKKPDIILLAGGTDGGNKDCIIHNAKLIAEHIKDIPVVVAGNKNARDEIEDIFKANDVFYKATENVMPRLNTINVEPAREVIREIFMAKIVEAKGMKNAENFISGILMPTPAAVLKAAQALADGSDKEEGIGELVIIDIGGATTDVHSIASGEPTKPGVTLRGLQEPYAKRTVEGDLGMRVSSASLWEAAGTRRIKKFIPDTKYDIEERCKYLQQNVNVIPQTQEEIEFDEALGMTATEIAMERHVGQIESVYTPMGIIYSQVGKDLLNVKYLIGTGGVLVHSPHPERILKAGTFDTENPNFLKPINPQVLIDRTYILSAMGLLAQKYPDKAVRIMKKYLVKA
ncbi:mutL [Fervidicella metallireducens AeB]|uniref:MutL n=1 Tax=Fervidicella metallireducens AeB TaxID=1403537 RepID=A0A017RX79_9CLOT|nr:methylaspartate mutase accessory protein GlmL [Fervidicella metallireducens]EYE88994.1 mutL [Fervidicella metallireducens AeB]